MLFYGVENSAHISQKGVAGINAQKESRIRAIEPQAAECSRP